jgi:two-component system OmpR family response regulator
VLVVDDDDGQRAAMATTLRRAGYDVTTACSGAAAVELGRAGPADVAVIDVFLGDAGGLGLARELRRELPDVRVLFVTGLSLPAVRQALAPAPVLFKPFTTRDLLASLRALAPWP